MNTTPGTRQAPTGGDSLSGTLSPFDRLMTAGGVNSGSTASPAQSGTPGAIALQDKSLLPGIPRSTPSSGTDSPFDRLMATAAPSAKAGAPSMSSANPTYSSPNGDSVTLVYDPPGASIAQPPNAAMDAVKGFGL